MRCERRYNVSNCSIVHCHASNIYFITSYYLKYTLLYKYFVVQRCLLERPLSPLLVGLYTSLVFTVDACITPDSCHFFFFLFYLAQRFSSITPGCLSCYNLLMIRWELLGKLSHSNNEHRDANSTRRLTSS